MTRGKYITPAELSIGQQLQQPKPMALHDEESELQRIKDALAATGGNNTKTAQLLAIDRKTLYNKMQKYGIPQ